jgi:HK97 family phage portal protein
MAELIQLHLPDPPALEKRDDGPNLNQAGVSLSAGLAALGMGTFVDSNENVNERTAFEVPTYLTCVRILSESVASLPLRVYEKLPRSQRPAPDHYLYYLLSQRPNPQMSAKVFFQTLMIAAVGWSNAYAEIERDHNGRAIALWPRLPWKTKPVRNAGILSFETTDTGNGQPRKIKSEDMLHIVGFSFDGLTGTPLVRFARQCIGLALVAARYGARFYANGARNCFYLQADHELSPEEMTDMRLDVEALSSGANAFRVGMLPNGVKIEAVPTNDEALTEYISTSKMTRDEIAAFMRVPGYMVGSTEKVMKSTIEAQNREFLTYALQPWLIGIQQELQFKLLPPVGRAAGKYEIRFYLDALLAADTVTLTAKQTAGRMGGWLSANDIREQLGMEPIPGGDEYLVPLNTTNASEAALGVETVNDPEDVSPNQEDGQDVNDPAARAQYPPMKSRSVPPTAKRARELYLPMFTDALARLQHRSKQDSSAITQTISPIAAGLVAYFRSTGEPGANEIAAVNKYVGALESRMAKGTADQPETEFDKFVKSIVFAVEADKAEARARKAISNE